MKRIILAAVLAIGLMGVASNKAEASGCGGPYGIGPGFFSINLGLNVQWSGLYFGRFPNAGYGNGYPCNGGPCYGPPAAPAMYNAYGYGQGYGYSDYGHGWGH
jgi:hypothetical protein